jgi:transcription elongation GreA/GreB family factor
MAEARRMAQGDGMRPLLTYSEHAACVRRLEELRTIRDRDIPQLLREARQFVASDADEEIVQLRELLGFVTARVAVLEQRLRVARLVVCRDAGSELLG